MDDLGQHGPCVQCGEHLGAAKSPLARTCSGPCRKKRSKGRPPMGGRPDETRPPCDVCGNSIDGRHRSALRCSEVCDRVHMIVARIYDKHGHELDRKETHAVWTSNHRCQICGSISDLCLDHDHAEQAPRGVLCRRCNSGIGMFGDDPTLLASAILYLTVDHGMARNDMERPFPSRARERRRFASAFPAKRNVETL